MPMLEGGWFYAIAIAGVAAGCGANVVVDGPAGSGGAPSGGSPSGGQTTTTSAATAMDSGATAAGETTTSASGAMNACDAIGACIDSDNDVANDCMNCAANGPCLLKFSACLADDDCFALISCLNENQCGGNKPCFDACYAQHPDGAPILKAGYACVCATCAISCAMRPCWRAAGILQPNRSAHAIATSGNAPGRSVPSTWIRAVRA